MSNKLSFRLDDEINQRVVEFSITLREDTIVSEVEAFRYYLLSAGYSENVINKYLVDPEP